MNKNDKSTTKVALDKANEKAKAAEKIRAAKNARKQQSKEELEKYIKSTKEKISKESSSERKTKAEYRKFLNRQKRANKKIAKAQASVKTLEEKKRYAIMVSYDQRLYKQISEVVKTAVKEKKMPQPDIITNIYFSLDLASSNTLEDVKKLVYSKDCTITIKRYPKNITLKPRVSACKSLKWEKMQNLKKESQKKPTMNTTEQKLIAKKKRKTKNLQRFEKQHLSALRRNLRKKSLQDVIEALDKKTIKTSDAEAWVKSPTKYKINAVGKNAKKKIGQHSAGSHAKTRKNVISMVKIMNMKQLKKIQSKEMKGAA